MEIDRYRYIIEYVSRISLDGIIKTNKQTLAILPVASK